MYHKPVIFISYYVVIAKIVSSSLDNDYVPMSEFDKLAKKYVLLHLSEELPKANELAKTHTGRQRLFDWEDKRSTILRDVFLLRDRDTNKHEWHPNWRTRAQLFQKLQMEYLNALSAINFDVRRSTSPMPKITLTNEGPKIINRVRATIPDDHDQADPLVTDEEIKHVLRFHRPFDEQERRTITKETVKTTDLEPHRYKSKESENLRRLVKSYDIVDRELIRGLQEKNYDLLRASLQGKRASELYYQDRLFQAERLIAQFHVWKKYVVFHKDFDRIPRHFHLLDNDEAYRKYLNFDEMFFKGNVMYGYKNRRDDPASHGYGFEVNAKEIIGKRYEPMHEIYKEMRQFDMKRSKLEDLPTIDLLLERFKTWTFWFPQCRFDASQWFQKSSTDRDPSFMVKPRNVESNDPDRIFRDAKNSLSRDLIASKHSIFEKSKRFQAQIRKDTKSLMNTLIMDFTIFFNRITHYLQSMDKANLLLALTVESPTSKSLVRQRKLLKETTRKTVMDHTHENPDSMVYRSRKSTEVDGMEKITQDLFNNKINYLVPESDKRETDDKRVDTKNDATTNDDNRYKYKQLSTGGDGNGVNTSNGNKAGTSNPKVKHRVM